MRSSKLRIDSVGGTLIRDYKFYTSKANKSRFPGACMARISASDDLSMPRSFFRSICAQ